MTTESKSAPAARGLTKQDAILAIPSMQRAGENLPIAPNAKCDRCGNLLLANPEMLAMVRRGVVDHAKCGGQFKEFSSEVPNV